MKTAIEYDPATNTVHICSWHQDAVFLQVKAEQEYPHASISHGCCEKCAKRVIEKHQAFRLANVSSTSGNVRQE